MREKRKKMRQGTIPCLIFSLSSPGCKIAADWFTGADTAPETVRVFHHDTVDNDIMNPL